MSSTDARSTTLADEVMTNRTVTFYTHDGRNVQLVLPRSGGSPSLPQRVAHAVRDSQGTIVGYQVWDRSKLFDSPQSALSALIGELEDRRQTFMAKAKELETRIRDARRQLDLLPTS